MLNVQSRPSQLMGQLLTARGGAPNNPAWSNAAPKPLIDVVAGDRRRPQGPKPTLSTPLIGRPTLHFSDACPLSLRHKITTTFEKVGVVGKTMGLGGAIPKTFNVHYIDRNQWKRQQSTIDREMAKQFPMSGLRAMWTRLTRWLSRQAHAWTTPIYFERESAGEVYIIAENFCRQDETDQNRGLAEVLVRSMQRATYPAFFKGQQDALKQLHIDNRADARLFTCKEATAEMNVRLCLDALEHNEGIVLHHQSRVPAWLHFWHQAFGKDLQRVLQQLRDEPQIDVWFRTLFTKPIFTRFLFQRGDEVEISDRTADENEMLLRRLRSINPYGAPFVKRSSDASR